MISRSMSRPSTTADLSPAHRWRGCHSIGDVCSLRVVHECLSGWIEGEQGAGIVQKAAERRWILANFDIGKSFIKQTHWETLQGNILAEMMPLLVSGDVLVTLTGETSST